MNSSAIQPTSNFLYALSDDANFSQKKPHNQIFYNIHLLF